MPFKLVGSGKMDASKVVAILAILVLVLSYLAYLTATENYKNLAIWFSFVFATVLSALVFKNWRVGVVAFFVWLPFEDLARKFLGNSLILYAVKDFVVGFTYLSFVSRRVKNPAERFKNPLRFVLVLWFVWALAEFFNPNITNLLVPVLGLRMSFFYIPMIYLGYAFFEKERQLRDLFLLLTCLACVVSILGLIQSVVGPGFLNPSRDVAYLRLDLVRRTAEGQEIYRPTGPFVDAGRYIAYVFAGFFVGCGLVFYLHASKQWAHRKELLAIAWVSVIVTFAAIFQSGTRMAVIGAMMAAGLFLLLKTREIHRVGTRMPIGKFAIAVAAAFLLLSRWQPKALSTAFDIYRETLLPSSQHEEVTGRRNELSHDWYGALEAEPLIGHGTGTNSLGIQYILSEKELLANGEVEAGYAAVIWEWGIGGLALWLAWTVTLAIVLFKAVKSLKNTSFYWMTFSFTFFVVFVLFPWFLLGLQVYQNYSTQSLLFFLAGAILKMPKLVAEGASKAALAPAR